MKTFLTLFLLGLSVAALAQQSRTSMTHTSIDDDDKEMSIQVEGTVNGKDVHYSRRFNVAGMSSAQKEALKDNVFDSLGLGKAPKPPVAPAPPAPPRPEAVDGSTVTFTCPTCTGRMKLLVTGDGYSMTQEHNTKKGDKSPFPLALSLKPGDYRYEYWQNGVQQMQLPFTVKEGERNEVKVK